MNPSSMSLISGSKNGSNDIGHFAGSRQEGTNPMTYTSSTLHLSSFGMVAIVNSIAPIESRSSKKFHIVSFLTEENILL